MSNGTSVGKIQLDLGLNYNDFKKQMGGIGSQAKSMIGGIFTKLGLVAAAAFSVTAMVGFGKEAIKLASDLQEVQNVVDVAFGSMNTTINNFAKQAGEKFGLTELAAKKYTGTMGAMLKSTGLNQKQTAEMAMTVAGLAGDFASFYNLDAEDAFAKIKAGIAGETDGLKQLGINLSQTALQEYALTKGITKNVSTISQADQSLLRYELLMKRSTDAQGDFVRTSGSWANQVRIMQLRWGEFKASIGQGLMTLFTPVLKVLNTVLQYLVKVGQVFSQVMSKLFGVKQQTASTAKAMATLASGTDTAADSQDDLAKSTKKAGAAAKASLGSFDKLNIIGEEAGAGAGDIGDIGGGGSNFDDMFGDTSSITDEASANIDAFATKVEGIFKNLGYFLSSFYENELKVPLEQFGAFFKDTIWPGITQSFNTFKIAFTPVFTKYFSLIGSVAGDVWSSFKQALPGLLEQAGTTFTSLNTLWQQYATVLGSITAGFIDVIQSLWDKWGKETWDKIWITLTGIWESFNLILNEWIIPVVRDGLAWLQEMWDKHLKDIVYAIGDFVMKVINGAMDLWNGFIKPVIDWLINVLAPIFKNVFKVIMDVLGSAFQFFKEVFAGWFKILGGVIDFIVGIFTGNWKRAWEGLKNIFIGIWDIIKSVFNLIGNQFMNIINAIASTFAAAYEAVKIAFEPIINWFKGVWESIKSVFSTVGDWFKGIFTGAKDAIVGVFGSVGTALKKPVNAIIDMVNSLIRKLNGFSVKLPDILGGDSIGFNIPTIPRLAKGGIVSNPTLAMVGDNKRSPEVIAPLHELTDMLKASGSQSNEQMIDILKMILSVLKSLDISTEVYIGNERLDDFIEKRKKRKQIRAGKLISSY